jgi:hypothetical protein
MIVVQRGCTGLCMTVQVVHTCPLLAGQGSGWGGVVGGYVVQAIIWTIQLELS